MENSVSDSNVGSDALPFVEMFEASEESTQEARDTAEKCRDYYDNKQWTASEVQELNRRGQPVITDNVIAGKINWLVGQEMQKRTDPKAFPRTPQHEQGAEAVTDATRFVVDNQNFDRLRSGVWQDMLIEGFGGVEVIHRNTRNGPEVILNRYPWDRLFYDPHSREDDFSDARYKGSVTWTDSDLLVKQNPKAADAIEGNLSGNWSNGETYEDRPRWQTWGDRQGKRVRVVLMWHLDADHMWKWVRFTNGFVFGEGESPYVDDEGQSVCPLVMQSAHCDRDNNRYGEVVKMLTQQDEINKRRSKLLHMANSRQTMGIKGAVDSTAALKRELAKPDGHVEYTQMDDSNRPSFSIIPQQDIAGGQFALLQEAKESIQQMGATEALQGRVGPQESGRAVLARQQGAMQGITPLNDKLSNFSVNVYKQIWYRIRQLWTQEKWIRITDDERNVRFVGLNKPVTLADTLQQHPMEVVQEFAYRNQLVPNDPRLQQVVAVENQLAGMDVDLIMEEVPDMVTLEAETFENLVQIDAARGGVLPLEMLIEAAPLRSTQKEKILKGLEENANAQGQQGQQQEQMMQQAMQVDMQDKVADIEKKKTEAIENMADAEKTRAETRQTEVETRQLMLGLR